MSNTKNVKNKSQLAPEKIAEKAVNEVVKERTCPSCGAIKTPATTHKLCHRCYQQDRKARIELFGVSKISQLAKETTS